MKRGAVSLVFDDGYKEIYDLVLPLLKKYNLKAVFAVPVNVSEVPLEKWKEVAEKEGHEIAAHGINHTDLTTLSEIELDEELRRNSETLKISTLVYPGGGSNEKVRNAAKKYFSAGRTVLWGFEKIKPKDPYSLKTFNANRKNFRVWKWNLLALWACLTNSWMIETYHRVTSDPEVFHTVLLKDLEAHFRFLSRLPVKNETIKESIDKNV